MSISPLTRRLPVFATLTVLMAGSAQPVHAQLPSDARFTYDLFLQGSSTPIAGSLNYLPGTPLTIHVYLRQSAGSTNVLVNDGGLVTGGVRLTFGSPTGTPGVITVPSVNAIAINTGSGSTQFNDEATSNASRDRTADYAQFVAATDLTRGAVPEASGRVFLGTVTFQTPGGGSGTTQLRAENPPQQDDTFTFQGAFASTQYSLDSRIDPFVVQVVPVPEPAALLAVVTGALAAGAAVRRTRRRRANGLTPSPATTG